MSNDKMIIKEGDLGVWFGIDHKAIHNEPQFDLAVIALAECYGFALLSPQQMQVIHKVVHRLPEEALDRDLIDFLTALSDLAFTFLALQLPTGYEFKFAGEDYSKLELAKV